MRSFVQFLSFGIILNKYFKLSYQSLFLVWTRQETLVNNTELYLLQSQIQMEYIINNKYGNYGDTVETPKSL